jgi:regulator of sigma E protease
MDFLTGYWSLLYQIPVGLVGLSFMVFIHELGHFLAAKWSGVKVHTFSIGFGKKLLRFKRGDTEYCLSAVPFGGYVAMAGENPDEGGYGNTDEFRVKPVPVRIFIAIAGPAANLIFAVFILFCLYLVGVQEPKYSMIVGNVEKESAAEKAGVLPGDEILSFRGKPMKDWEAFITDAAMEGGNAHPLQIRRGGQDATLMLTPEMHPRFGVALTGILGEWEVKVHKVMPDMPAEKGGLREGDVIESIDGTKIPSSTALVEMVNGSKGRSLDFALRRNDEKVRIALTPQFDKSSERYLIGIYPANVVPTQLVKRGVLASAKASVTKTGEHATLVFRTFGKIITGQVHLKALSGPIGIVQMIAGSLRQSLQKFLEFMALLNTNLGVLNLLPLAITDGGLVLFLLVEAVRRKPLSLRTQGVINRLGISFFVMLFLFVTFHDFLRIPWLLD